MKLSLGFSPCPNDTFMFDALINHKIDTEGLDFDIIFEDVESLNMMGINADFDSNLQLLFLEAEEPEIINIDLAKKIYDNDLAVFIDARDNSDFIQGHIKNSINASLFLISG